MSDHDHRDTDLADRTHIEAAARKMAEGMNGGDLETHYTVAQRQVWCGRFAEIWGCDHGSP